MGLGGAEVGGDKSLFPFAEGNECSAAELEARQQKGLITCQFASSRKKIAVRTAVLMVPDLCLLKVLWYQKMWARLLKN